MTRRLAIAVTLTLTLITLTLVPPATAQFPPRDDDLITSLGLARVFVNLRFRSLLEGYPGYDGASRLESPILSDPNTTVGRSDPHLDGDANDTVGTPVGVAGTMVSDTDFSLVPQDFEGPPGTREVHIEMRELNLTDTSGLGVAVRAGVVAPGRPISPGEVESLDPSGNATLDFPAEAFFNVFLEMDLPAGPTFPGGTLYNQEPLLLLNHLLDGFPSRVVFVHGNTEAVPFLFRDDNPGFWQADDLFGWLALAGLGMSFGLSDTAEFEAEMSFQREMPLPPGVMIGREIVAVEEGGSTDAYAIALTSQPTADVTVSVSPDAQLSVSATTVTFTPSNWNASQTITVAAVDDTFIEGPHTGSIAHNALSSDPEYSGIAIAQVTASITDNDVLGPTVPSMPQNLQATAGDSHVSLAWDSPLEDGGSPITSYRIYRGLASGSLSLRLDVGDRLEFDDTGLVNGVTYFYQVTAVNDIGEGPRSDQTSATPVRSLDTTRPMIFISEPRDGATLNSVSVTVSGTATDDVAVEKVEVSTDGMTWRQATGKFSWSGTLTLVEGSNTIFARATDTSGNMGTVSITVTVDTRATLLTWLLIGGSTAVVAGVSMAILLSRFRGKALLVQQENTWKKMHWKHQLKSVLKQIKEKHSELLGDDLDPGFAKWDGDVKKIDQKGKGVRIDRITFRKRNLRGKEGEDLDGFTPRPGKTPGDDVDVYVDADMFKLKFKSRWKLKRTVFHELVHVGQYRDKEGGWWRDPPEEGDIPAGPPGGPDVGVDLPPGIPSGPISKPGKKAPEEKPKKPPEKGLERLYVEAIFETIAYSRSIRFKQKLDKSGEFSAETRKIKKDIKGECKKLKENLKKVTGKKAAKTARDWLKKHGAKVGEKVGKKLKDAIDSAGDCLDEKERDEQKAKIDERFGL